MKQTVRIAGGISELFGTLDENLKLFEANLHVTTHLKDHDLEIEGEPAQVERAALILDEYNQRVRDGRIPDSQEVKSLLRIATQAPAKELRGAFSPTRTRTFGKKSLAPKSTNQRRYIEALETYDMVFAIGPGGTGKTYLAVAMAVSALLSKQVNRIILARPAVEAGEKLGFLPGTLQEKVDPYMRPLYDALHDLLEAEKLESFLEKDIIEVAPLAFMRGLRSPPSLSKASRARAPRHLQQRIRIRRRCPPPLSLRRSRPLRPTIYRRGTSPPPRDATTPRASHGSRSFGSPTSR